MSEFTMIDLYNKNVTPDVAVLLLQSKDGPVGDIYQDPFEVYQKLNNIFVTDDNVGKYYVSVYKKLNGMEDVCVLNLLNPTRENENTLEIICTNPQTDRIYYGASNARKGDLMSAEMFESRKVDEERVIKLYSTLLNATIYKEDEQK